MSFTIKYNRNTVHIAGLTERTVYTGDGEDDGSGVVPYYAESACGSLTRSGFRMAQSTTHETASEALEAARTWAAQHGLKVCKNCEKAAKWAISYEFDAESDEFEAEKERVEAELQASNDRYKAAKAAEAAPVERKARTFTVEFNASESVLIAAALREKAVIERNNAKAYRTNAEIEGTTLVEFYTNQAKLADNRAKLLEDAAERMHKPVREAITKAVANAIPDEPEPAFHRKVKDAIGLRW